MGFASDLISQALEITFVLATQLEFGRVPKLQKVLAVSMRPHGRHTMTIDDRRAMHTHERLGVEQDLEVLHRPTQDKRLTARMNTHVVTGRVHPIDCLNIDVVRLRAVANRYAGPFVWG